MKRKILTVVLFLVLVSTSLSPILPCSAGRSDLYRSKDVMLSWFMSLCDNNPGKADRISVGKTLEGNDIWMFRFGNPNGGVVLWDGQLHGDEDIPSEIEYLIATWLVSSDSDEANRILEGNYVLFIPVIQYDSYARKNARRSYTLENGSTLLTNGVDLNRNFPTSWSAGSTDPYHWSYRGLYAMSEPETEVMNNVFQTYEPTFYMNGHQWAATSLGWNRWWGANTTLIDNCTQLTQQYCDELGAPRWVVRGVAEGGYATVDATQNGGACSVLIEFYETRPDFSVVTDTLYPMSLALFRAMCELCEVVSEEPTPPPEEPTEPPEEPTEPPEEPTQPPQGSENPEPEGEMPTQPDVIPNVDLILGVLLVVSLCLICFKEKIKKGLRI